MQFQSLSLVGLFLLAVSYQAHTLDVCTGNLSTRTLGGEFHANLQRVCVKDLKEITVEYEVVEVGKTLRRTLEGKKTKLKSPRRGELIYQNARKLEEGDYSSDKITLYLREKDRIRSEGSMAEHYEGRIERIRILRKDQSEIKTTLANLHFYAESHHPLHWGYDGKRGPKEWAGLSPDFELCEEGSLQSPVGLETSGAKQLSDGLELKYSPSEISLVNNGHTLQANVLGENKLEFRGKQYRLLQFHIHTPSEHELDGRGHMLEVHFVHQSEKDKSFAVLGVFVDALKESEKSDLVEDVLNEFPKAWNKPHEFSKPISPRRLVPEKLAFFHYAGSLTTPPCSEGISWFVLKEPVQISAAQLQEIKDIVGGANARRPLSKLGSREVFFNDSK